MKKNFISIFLLFILICFITPSLAGKKKIDETESSSGQRQAKTPRQESGDSVLAITESDNLNDEQHELDDAAKLLPRESSPESSTVKTYRQDLVDNTSSASNVGEGIDRRSALEKIKWLGSFHHDCSPEALGDKENKEKLEGTDLTDLLKACEFQAVRWLRSKIEMLGEFGTLIQNWFQIIDNSGRSINIDMLLDERTKATEELRSNEDFYYEVFKTWRTHQNYMHGTEESEDPLLTWSPIESTRRAFHFGDGICIQILESPFDRVEKFLDAVLRDFGQVNYSENFPTSMRIYIFQKLCRKFYQTPNNPENSEIAITNFDKNKPNEPGRNLFQRHLNKMNVEESGIGGPKCNWNAVFRRKQMYRVLSSIRRARDFKELRAQIDNSIDNLVENCLRKIEERGATKIFADVTPAKKSFIRVIYIKFKSALDKYTLSLDQSVNNVLDMRASDNKIKQDLFKEIELIVAKTPYLEYAKLSVDFLSGHFSDREAGIFRDEIYARQPESEVLGFLSHVFSIKGYKPKVTILSPLLKFYYLYKMSEICHLMPVDETFEFVGN